MHIKYPEYWANKEEYTPNEAACLVYDQIPGMIEDEDRELYLLISNVEKRLKNDTYTCNGRSTDYLEFREPRERGGLVGGRNILGNKEYFITHNKLKEWCLKNSFWPLIFFPDGKPNHNELDLKTRKNLLRTIGSLAILLIEKSAAGKLGTRASPNVHAIFKEIDSLLAEMGVSNEGQGKSNLSKLFKEAIELTLKK